jgi:beta-lactamase regulating signal transducer with metallopeptidase domain
MNTMTWLQNGAAWAWHTSLVAAIPGTILLALGLWRGFPPRWRMFLAAALLLRLLLPWVPELPGYPDISFANVAPAVAEPSAAHAIQKRKSAKDETVTSMVTQAAPDETRVSWRSIAVGFWLLGVIGVGTWLCVSHGFIRRSVSRRAVTPDAEVAKLFRWACERMGLQQRVGLVAMPRITTAAVCGWLRPIVLVPRNLRQTHTNDEIRAILLHELVHVRRCDVLWSWLGLTACGLHWFNPLAWLALRRFHVDRELECDRMAIQNLTMQQRNAYAPALYKTLRIGASTMPAALVPFFRRKHEIHTRILTIMKPSKSLPTRLAAMLFIPILCVLTLTTGGADGKKPAKKDVAETPATSQQPQDERALTESKVPVLGDVPILGRLFEKQLVKAPEDGAKNDSDAVGDGKGARDGAKKKEGVRDGEAKKQGPRDGEVKKQGPRDGEVKKEGARDGEAKKTGVRDGEGTRKTGARDGEGTRKGARDGEATKKSGEGAADGKAVTLRVLGTGEEVSINGDKVATSGLRGYLSEHLAAGSNVIVAAEETVPYGALMNVVDAARDNGAKGIKIDAHDSNREGGAKTRTAEGR